MKLGFLIGGGGGVALQSITIDTDATGLNVGGTRQLTATGHYSDSSTLNLTSAVTWSSSDEDVATIGSGSGGGIMDGAGVGSTTITATLGSVHGTASGTVTGVLTGQLLAAADDVHASVGGPLETPLETVIAAWIPSTVTQVRVKYANRVFARPGGALTPQPTGPTTGCKLAVGAINTTGDAWTGSPTVITGVTLPAAGGIYTSDWIDVTGLRNANGEIGVAWSVPTGVPFYGEYPGDFGLSAINDDMSPLSGLVDNGVNPLFIYLEFLTAQNLIFIGDSLTRGLSSVAADGQPTYKQTLGRRLGPDHSLTVLRAAGSGQSLVSWQDTDGIRPWLYDYINFNLSRTAIFLGTNDVNLGSATLEDMQAALAAIRDRAIAGGAVEVWAWTVAPSSNYTSDQNTLRNAYNAWLRGGVTGIDYVLDADLVLRDPDNHSQLLATYACNDAFHFTSAANAALEAQLVTDGKV